MRANRLPAVRGLRWIAGAFAIFRVAPLRQLVLCLAFLFASTLMVTIPLVGFALIWLLFPALLVGPHAVARSAARGATPAFAMLTSGFRHCLPAQLRTGALFLALMLLVLAGTALADEGRFALAVIGRARLTVADLEDFSVVQAMLIGALLQTVLLGLVWYAPLLVAWHGVSASQAAFYSAAAVLINWRAFLAYGIALSVLFGAVLLLAMAGAMVMGGGGAGQANSALFSVVWALLPVWFASSYLGYRDVFSEDAPLDAAPKSPTISP